jgi:hypothetical protein
MVLKNIVWSIFMMAIWSVFGGVFFGCRMFQLEIFNSMALNQVLFLSLPHVIAYSVYFIFVELVQMVTYRHLVRFLIFFKDPASDDDARKLEHFFKFYYVFGIEMIPPLFFLIIEPFANTSCFSKSCINEIRFYAYSRYTAILFEVFVRTITGYIIKYQAKAQKVLNK